MATLEENYRRLERARERQDDEYHEGRPMLTKFSCGCNGKEEQGVSISLPYEFADGDMGVKYMIVCGACLSMYQDEYGDECVVRGGNS